VQLSVAKKGLLMAAVPLVLGLIYLAVLSVMLENAEATATRESRSRAIIAEANHAQRDLFDAGSAIVAWNYMRSDVLEERLDKCLAAIPERASRLKELMKDDPSRAGQLKELGLQATKVVGVLQWHKKRIKETPQDVYHFEFGKFRRQIEGAFKTYVDELHTLTYEEQKIQEHVPQNEEARKQEIRLYIFGGVLLNLALSLGLATFFSRDIAARLQILSENAGRFVERKSLLPPVAGSDEVAEVDAAFRKMAEEVNEAEETKQAFVAMVSHDLRSPLSAIQGAIELVESGLYGEISDKGKVRLESAQRECDRLLSLINELLDIEKIEAGMMEMNLQTTDLAEVAMHSAETLKAVADLKGIKFEIFGGHIEAFVDRERMIQVFINLFSNAIKYSPRGGTVTVTLAHEKKYASVKIEDHGRGIPRDALETVFDRFKQAHGGGAGTSGLGLAICKAIVEAHHGKIGVVSEVGSGSLFWMQLPIH